MKETKVYSKQEFIDLFQEYRRWDSNETQVQRRSRQEKSSPVGKVFLIDGEVVDVTNREIKVDIRYGSEFTVYYKTRQLGTIKPENIIKGAYVKFVGKYELISHFDLIEIREVARLKWSSSANDVRFLVKSIIGAILFIAAIYILIS
ncbi:MAG: hypothetical protein RIE86_01800 [Imperialibacter sp.]|uniref:hypothetical protein n=1 Tax=Imperialibacter sp. TaxID=2038411 RepID=UPI0032F08AEC